MLATLLHDLAEALRDNRPLTEAQRSLASQCVKRAGRSMLAEGARRKRGDAAVAATIRKAKERT